MQHSGHEHDSEQEQIRPLAQGGFWKPRRQAAGPGPGHPRAGREDGMALAQLWWDIARDETRRDSDRLEASKLLADRGWGKAAAYQTQEGDPLDLALAEQAAEEFRAKILRLADEADQS